MEKESVVRNIAHNLVNCVIHRKTHLGQRDKLNRVFFSPSSSRLFIVSEKGCAFLFFQFPNVFFFLV